MIKGIVYFCSSKSKNHNFETLNMKKVSYLTILVCLSLTFSFLTDSAHAQMRQRGGDTQVRVTGWSDDTHYILQTLDADKKPVTLNVDIRTGKGVPYTAPKSARDLLNESLPKGTTLSFSDIVSSDNKSVLIIKDYDLYYFKMGDTDLRRLTNDKVQKVNARFSPDGKKVAYTKNKDLYVFDLVANKELRLTSDASDRVYNGYSSWVYMEEILGRASRYAAFWFSPDGSKIAYLRTDETQVPVFTLNRLDEADRSEEHTSELKSP
jgi:dipeptidyl-peptidase-4